ncbi:hypothetical protein B0T11DRAFT_315240 [Plectosphaerella cucumerina]|uniref:Uncharacterized protein n=1 Tax=Plectosphaerella cucumerina TaxID=40658 RepID=A0A8K0TVC7_9PEZI|nr:hypothetical protein B0T11DRAFT_315240 [Plectosphaerella cucumerina]
MIPDFWLRTLCNSNVAHRSDLSLVVTPGKPKRGDDPRFAGRLWLETGVREARIQHKSLTPLWSSEVVDLNHIYQYSKGQYFDAHFFPNVVQGLVHAIAARF